MATAVIPQEFWDSSTKRGGEEDEDTPSSPSPLVGNRFFQDSLVSGINRCVVEFRHWHGPSTENTSYGVYFVDSPNRLACYVWWDAVEDTVTNTQANEREAGELAFHLLSLPQNIVDMWLDPEQFTFDQFQQLIKSASSSSSSSSSSQPLKQTKENKSLQSTRRITRTPIVTGLQASFSQQAILGCVQSNRLWKVLFNRDHNHSRLRALELNAQFERLRLTTGIKSWYKMYLYVRDMHAAIDRYIHSDSENRELRAVALEAVDGDSVITQSCMRDGLLFLIVRPGTIGRDEDGTILIYNMIRQEWHPERIRIPAYTDLYITSTYLIMLEYLYRAQSVVASTPPASSVSSSSTTPQPGQKLRSDMFDCADDIGMQGYEYCGATLNFYELETLLDTSRTLEPVCRREIDFVPEQVSVSARYMVMKSRDHPRSLILIDLLSPVDREQAPPMFTSHTIFTLPDQVRGAVRQLRLNNKHLFVVTSERLYVLPIRDVFNAQPIRDAARRLALQHDFERQQRQLALEVASVDELEHQVHQLYLQYGGQAGVARHASNEYTTLRDSIIEGQQRVRDTERQVERLRGQLKSQPDTEDLTVSLGSKAVALVQQLNEVHALLVLSSDTDDMFDSRAMVSYRVMDIERYVEDAQHAQAVFTFNDLEIPPMTYYGMHVPTRVISSLHTEAFASLQYEPSGKSLQEPHDSHRPYAVKLSSTTTQVSQWLPKNVKRVFDLALDYRFLVCIVVTDSGEHSLRFIDFL